MTKQRGQCSKSNEKIVNPFLALMLDTDVPTMMFQPMKMIALGQIHGAALLSRRCSAYVRLPHEMIGLRSPLDVMQVNIRFWQTALRDYSEAIQLMAEAWGGFGEEYSARPKQSHGQHDYLKLPSDEPESEDNSEQPMLRVVGSDKRGRTKDCAA